jgi:hypothetical protein
MIGWLLSAAAVAGETPASPEPSPSPAPHEKKDEGKLEVFGRVLANDAFSSTDDPSGRAQPWVGLLSLESVRAGAKYKADDLKVEVELELRKGAALRNAYVQLLPGHGLDVKGGFFKIPQSAIELTSLWDLPLAHRGMVNDVVGGPMGVGGRAAGGQIAWSSAEGWRPEIRAGAFQSLVLDAAGKPAALPQRASSDFGMNVASRAAIHPAAKLEVGVFGEVRNSSPVAAKPPLRSWSSGADVTLHDAAGWQVWADAQAGNDLYDTFNQVDAVQPVFSSGRLIVAKRFGGTKKDSRFVEPYAMAEAIDPDRVVKWDLAWEGVVGLDAGQWDRWKAQLQFETVQVATQTPHGLGPSATQPDLADRQAVLLQLGAVF